MIEASENKKLSSKIFLTRIKLSSSGYKANYNAARGIKIVQLELSHHGHEKFLDFLDGSCELQGGTILGVLDGEQHVQLVR